ncbi:glycosyltransferase family 4 protein [Pendulispora albinea]|uniref:Glycosyltransferase family 4 protein n=1 Tax=Pendulispora albinea TaxID=2741071 RepID=A0ABZ2LL95_9BACT
MGWLDATEERDTRGLGGLAKRALRQAKGAARTRARVRPADPAERSWHIVVGEYPPMRGGVSDYTRELACALAKAGDEVHVWAPAARGPLVEDPGVVLHPLVDGFGPKGMVALARGLGAPDPKKRLLVQYVAQSFGYKGLNLPFCLALASRREDFSVMFHEVAHPFERGQPLRHKVLAGVTHAMAAVLAYRANRIFVSTSTWDEYLRAFVPGVQRARWLPVPSGIPRDPSPSRIAEVRAAVSEGGRFGIVGHFGTYGSVIVPLLEQSLLALFARHATCKALLAGGRGIEFAEQLSKKHPSMRSRIVAIGHQPGEEAAAHLAACDVAIQPYPDGITSRRTTAMAHLALGVPLVANEGTYSESIWRDELAVELVRGATAEAMGQMADRACALLADPGRAKALGARGLGLYDRLFALERTVEILRSQAPFERRTGV